jgi:vacuolar-type H+-ATPase subunit E/Vma4
MRAILKWHIAKRRKTIEKLADGWQKDLVQAYEKLKAQVRASGASVSHRQKYLQVQEDALQGLGQEQRAAQCVVRLE